jgi:hypothetical protein
VRDLLSELGGQTLGQRGVDRALDARASVMDEGKKLQHEIDN